MITIDLGEPQYGWLPVTFCAETFELVLDASAVPINPLEALCEMLAVVVAGGSARVQWPLEPAECWFDFENQAGDIVLTITERPSRTHPLTQVFRVAGTSKQVLMPFLRALSQFTARSYSETHWPKLSKHKLAQLNQLLKNSR
jgi:hypothetical protein